MSLLSLSAQTLGSVANPPSGGRVLLVRDLRSNGLQRVNAFGD